MNDNLSPNWLSVQIASPYIENELPNTHFHEQNNTKNKQSIKSIENTHI